MAFYDDPYFLAFFLISCITAYALYSLRLKNKRAVQSMEIKASGSTKGGKYDLNGLIDGAIAGIPMAQQIYDDSVAKMRKEHPGITDDQIKKDLKPLEDKINQAKFIQQYEPLARIGANLGNKAVKIVEELL